MYRGSRATGSPRCPSRPGPAARWDAAQRGQNVRAARRPAAEPVTQPAFGFRLRFALEARCEHWREMAAVRSRLTGTGGFLQGGSLRGAAACADVPWRAGSRGLRVGSSHGGSEEHRAAVGCHAGAVPLSGELSCPPSAGPKGKDVLAGAAPAGCSAWGLRQRLPAASPQPAGDCARGKAWPFAFPPTWPGASALTRGTRMPARWWESILRFVLRPLRFGREDWKRRPPGERGWHAGTVFWGRGGSVPSSPGLSPCRCSNQVGRSHLERSLSAAWNISPAKAVL